MAQSKKNRIVLIAIIIFIACAFVCLYLFLRNNEYDKASDDISYLQRALKEKYKVGFVFTGETLTLNSSESSSDSTLTGYRFYPTNDSDLIITATCGFSSDSGMINTVIPFERHRWFNDDLTECVKKIL